ncbi:MAG: hypothetical protein L6461_05170 [Anaerolineae bacterium]|nr:hypothetical protein [Anaerolineae bacterium]
MSKTQKPGLGRFLSSLIAIPIVVALVGVTPTSAKTISYNFTAMYIALCLGVVILIVRALIFLKPNWKVEFLELILPMPAFGGVLALNLVYASLPDWRWIAPLAIMYPVAIALPFFNQGLSNRLANEINAPTSCLGKMIVFGILSIAPMAGFIGVWLSSLSQRAGNGVLGFSLVGFFLHFGFVWSEINLAQQAWRLIPKGRK